MARAALSLCSLPLVPPSTSSAADPRSAFSFLPSRRAAIDHLGHRSARRSPSPPFPLCSCGGARRRRASRMQAGRRRTGRPMAHKWSVAPTRWRTRAAGTRQGGACAVPPCSLRAIAAPASPPSMAVAELISKSKDNLSLELAFQWSCNQCPCHIIRKILIQMVPLIGYIEMIIISVNIIRWHVDVLLA